MSQSDEELARRLYEIELDEMRKQTQQQNNSDEELARRLAQEEDMIDHRIRSNQARSPAPAPLSRSSNVSGVRLQPGDKTSVKLVNTFTRNSIGEPVYVHYTTDNKMIFELVKMPQAYLHVQPEGSVAFVHGLTNATRFHFDAMENGQLCLKLIHHGIEKCLCISQTGQIYCDPMRSNYSMWMLVAVGVNEGVSPSPMRNTVLPPQLPQQQQPQQSIRQGGYYNLPQQDEPQTNSSFFETMNPLANVPMPPANPVIPSKLNITPPSTETNTPQQIFAWLTNSPDGQAYLNQSDLQPVRNLLSQGTLMHILHRPDWMHVAGDYFQFTKLDTKFNEQIAASCMPQATMRQFFSDGYVTLRDVFSSTRIQQIKRLINYYMFSKASKLSQPDYYYEALLNGPISSDFTVLSLFYDSPLIHVVQKLIGPAEIAPVTQANVVALPPSYTSGIEKSDYNNNMSRNWFINGFNTSGEHSPYSLLIGIAITDFSIDHSGNIVIYPDSHILLQEHAKQEIANRSDRFSRPEVVDGKPELSQSQTIMMRAGDVFLCSQKLARAISKNFSENIQYMIYFHISHVDHMGLKELALEADNLWVEYRGFSNLDKSDAPTNTTTATAASSHMDIDFGIVGNSNSDGVSSHLGTMTL